MSAIRGTIRDGKVVFDAPPGWPDGTPVTVELVFAVTVGLSEEGWPTDAAGIEALVARMDRLAPFLTSEDEAEWHKALAEQKARELANWDAYCKKLGDLFP